MYGIKLVIALIVVGGLIAYVGDKIGMKVGKKRLSLFGLRPRYTSIIITIVTGILIATTSLLLLMAASENVRMALFEMDSMLEKLDTLSVSLASKNQELGILRDQINEKVEDLNLLQEEKMGLEDRLRTVKDEYQETKEVKLELESTVERLNLQRESLTKQVDNLAYNLNLFGQKYIDSLTGDIVYQKGEIIVEDSIILSNKDEIKDKLKEMLAMAFSEAQKRGVSGERLEYSQEKLKKVVEVLNDEDGQAVVRLLAARNTLKGEGLTVDFDLYRDYKVYNDGDIILKSGLIAEDSLDGVEERLNEFLLQLNQEVIRNGILPDNRGEVGSINLLRLYPIVDDLLMSSGRVRVVAQDDIWRSEGLNDNIQFIFVGE